MGVIKLNPELNKIIIVVDGGLIQTISGIPKDIQIEVRDYDVEGVDEENITKIDDEEAVVTIWCSTQKK
jgi:hypothetical protein